MQDHSSASLENSIAVQKFGVGQPVRRKEDDTLVRGKGKYTDDFNLPGQLYAWIVRSQHAHGVIRGIDTEAAKAMPGVRGVWTAADLAAAAAGIAAGAARIAARLACNLLAVAAYGASRSPETRAGHPVEQRRCSCQRVALGAP